MSATTSQQGNQDDVLMNDFVDSTSSLSLNYGASNGTESVTGDVALDGDSPVVASVNGVNSSVASAASGSASAFHAVVAAPGGSVVSYSSNVNQRRERIEGLIAAQNFEIDELLDAFAREKSRGNHSEADNCLAKVEKARRVIDSLRPVMDTFIVVNKVRPKDDSNNAFGGMKLSRHDIPKFRLASPEFPIGGKVEVFESDKHYLAALENIVESSELVVERDWKKILPIGLDRYMAWVNTELKKCTSWTEAKAAFSKRFGSRSQARAYKDQVYTMVMNDKESILEYSNRFLQAVFMAGIDAEDTGLADRFLASLVYEVQTVVKMSHQYQVGEVPMTVDLMTSIARAVLGDDPSKYRRSTGVLPVAATYSAAHDVYGSGKRSRYNGSKQEHKRARMDKKPVQEKKFYCKQHRENDTHDTKDCFSLNATQTAKSNQPKSYGPCCRCDAPNWTRGHRCEKSEAKKVFSAEVRDTPPAAAIIETIEEQMNEQDELMEEGNNDKVVHMTISNHNDAFRLRTPVLVNGVKLIGKVDTGSDVSIINKVSLENKFKNNYKINKNNGSTLQYLNGSGKCYGVTNPLKFTYANGISFEHSLEVLDFDQSYDFDILLGKDILPRMNIGLTGVAYRIEGEHMISDNLDNDESMFKSLNIDDKSNSNPDNSPIGTPEEIERLMSRIKLAIEKNSRIPKTAYCTMPEAVVSLPTDEGKTARRMQYPIPKALIPVVDEQIQKWLDADVVEKSKTNTSFNAPLLPIPKRARDGAISGHRICMDVRELNNILPAAFNYQNRHINDILQSFEGAKVFSTLDLSEAFLKCPVKESDRHKLTFTHNGIQYHFKRACFGLTFMSSFFSKLMSILFDDMLDKIKFYCDDICIASSSIEEHVRDVNLVIERLTSVQLTLQPAKCVWFQKSVRLLGFVVSDNGISVDPTKVTNVASWPIPTSGKQIQQFSGLINYVREFVPLISRVTEPLTSLSNVKDVTRMWSDKHTKAFNALKEILQSNLLLHYPDMNREFYVATDASKYAVGGLLYQKGNQGRDKFISFISSTLVHSQRNWGTTKRELYALVLSLHKFRTYLWGRHFTVYTDHQALVYLHTQKRSNAMMIGWLETLLDYDFTVVHIPGILNKLPDALSRLYPPLEEDEPKLVGDRISSVKKTKHIKNNKALVKRKVYSKDRRSNVLATMLKQNKDEPLDYMTPSQEERNSVLEKVHTFGHFGSQAIVKEIHSQGLHWTNIYDDANKLVKSCIECQRHNIAKRGYHPLTNVVALKPFDHVAIDLAGPLPVTDEGDVYLFVLVDICTKYVVLRALKNKQSDTIARTLISIAGDYSFPKILSSDNGTEFKNTLQSKLNENLGIDRRYTTPYHPRGNGAAEASVKIAVNTIRKMSQSNGKDWAHYLPICQLAINNAIKNRTLSSPFALMYARRVNLPEDYASNSTLPLPNEMMTPIDLEERIEKMEKIVFPAIAERTKKISEEYKKKFDTRKEIVDIPVGSHVMVRLPNRPSKLAPIYDGPYTVVRKNQGGSYELKDEQNELLHRNYVPSELKVINIDESKMEEEYFEVEQIRDHRGRAGNREYLVKWKGYGERENTWQKAEDFTDPSFVQRYWDKVEQLKRQNEEANVKTTTINKKPTNNKRKLILEQKEQSNKRVFPSSLKNTREERYQNRKSRRN